MGSFVKLKNRFKKGSGLFFNLNSSLNIILTYNSIVIIGALIFYPLIPAVLNYAPGVLEGDYIAKWSGYSYEQQYIVILGLTILLGTIFLKKAFTGIDEWEERLAQSEGREEYLKSIRRRCMNLPYLIYIIQILFPVTSIATIHFFLKGPIILIIKTIILIFLFGSLTAIVAFTFSRKIFTRILLNTYQGNKTEGIRIGLRDKILLQVLPMFMVAILFTSLIGYSRLIKEKGDLIFQVIQNKLVSGFANRPGIDDPQQIQEILSEVKLAKIKEISFIIYPDKRVVTSDNSVLSKMFLDYIYELSPRYNGRVYELMSEVQGAVIKLKVKQSDWLVGVKYEVSSTEAMLFFLFSFVGLLGLNIFVVYYFSKALSDDIALVSNSLSQIAAGENVDLDKKLPVTSNDEIGDLVIAFNKILDLEKENIRQIRERQEMLIERERLATLGQLIGGIAHNLKTPIMSLAGGTEALKDLINEYQESVDDKNVTPADHQQIAAEMRTWIEEMKTYCAYMSDVITTVREQAVQMTVSSDYGFTIEELVKRIDLLLKYELKKYQCKMKLDIQVSKRTRLSGDITNLIQVLNNLILNAIHAYDQPGGKIELKVTGGEGYLEFAIRDFGKGIPGAIRQRLFKEMITTKGTKGTGLGLYMSHLTVKGKFGGNLWFESEEGQGTTFYIKIPVLNSPQLRQGREEYGNAQG